MTTLLNSDGRRFRTLGYHDAIRHDGPALELAEVVDGELGPALVTILFPADDPDAEPDVLLADGSLPLPILETFLSESARERLRLRALRDR